MPPAGRYILARVTRTSLAIFVVVVLFVAGVGSLGLFIDAHTVSKQEKIERLQDQVRDLELRVKRLEEAS